MRELIQDLIEEHKRIAEVVDDLDAEVGRFAADLTPDYELLFRVMSFIREYPDVTHHPKEEAVFAAWSRARPDAQPRVDRLIAEHYGLPR